MTDLELNNGYFKWMCQLVNDSRFNRGLSYLKLLRHLHDTVFQYTLPMDENRAADGVDLRYRFGYEHEYEMPMIAYHLDVKPCSVLEMLIALSLRCEESIMADPSEGNRTPRWFWEMITSLGLLPMDDSSFNKSIVSDVIFHFMNHEYAKNGKGGLFTIENCKYDMRAVEIWWQMNWYLDSIL